jgi:hypothetical protein
MDVRQVGDLGEESEGRVAPVAAQVSHAVSRRAVASSSDKYTVSDTSGKWYEMLNQAGAPEKALRAAVAKQKNWEEIFEVRKSIQSSLREALELHSKYTLRIIEVHIFAPQHFFTYYVFARASPFAFRSIGRNCARRQRKSRVHRETGVAAAGSEI